MHVPVRNRDDRGGDPRPGREDAVGVGARRRRGRLPLDRDAGSLAGLAERRQEDGVDDRTSAEHRAAAELDVAVLLLVDLGMVGRVCHVHHDRGIGLETVAAAAGSSPRPEADLFLRGGDGHDAGARSLLGRPTQGLENDRGAHPVVDRACGEAALGELDRVGSDDRDVADRDGGACLVSAGGPDVDPQVLELHRLAPVLGRHQVNRPATDDPEDLPLRREDLDALSHEHLRIPAADGADEEIALVVDVVHHEADLVDVTGQHDRGRAALADLGEGVPVDVGPHAIGEALGLRTPGARCGGLEARGSGRVEQPRERVSQPGCHRALISRAGRTTSRGARGRAARRRCEAPWSGSPHRRARCGSRRR